MAAKKFVVLREQKGFASEKAATQHAAQQVSRMSSGNYDGYDDEDDEDTGLPCLYIYKLVAKVHAQAMPVNIVPVKD